MPMKRMLALEPIVVNGIAYKAGEEFEIQASAASHLPEGFAEPVEVKAPEPEPEQPKPAAKKSARKAPSKRGRK